MKCPTCRQDFDLQPHIAALYLYQAHKGETRDLLRNTQEGETEFASIQEDRDQADYLDEAFIQPIRRAIQALKDGDIPKARRAIRMVDDWCNSLSDAGCGDLLGLLGMAD